MIYYLSHCIYIVRCRDSTNYLPTHMYTQQEHVFTYTYVYTTRTCIIYLPTHMYTQQEHV